MNVAQAAYVQVTGPDPKEVKANRQAFASTSDGTSRLSASGLHWCQSSSKSFILTPASLILPFIRSDKRRELASCKQSDLLELARFHLCAFESPTSFLECFLLSTPSGDLSKGSLCLGRAILTDLVHAYSPGLHALAMSGSRMQSWKDSSLFQGSAAISNALPQVQLAPSMFTAPHILVIPAPVAVAEYKSPASHQRVVMQLILDLCDKSSYVQAAKSA